MSVFKNGVERISLNKQLAVYILQENAAKATNLNPDPGIRYFRNNGVRDTYLRRTDAENILLIHVNHPWGDHHLKLLIEYYQLHAESINSFNAGKVFSREREAWQKLIQGHGSFMVQPVLRRWLDILQLKPYDENNLFLSLLNK